LEVTRSIHRSVLRAALGLLLAAGGSALADDAPAPLQSFAELRQLSRSEAARSRPISRKAVVVWTEDGSMPGAFALHDGTAAVYLDSRSSFADGLARFPESLPRELRMGQEVELEGFTHPGGYAPVIRPRMLRVLGEGRMPEPNRVSIPRLLAGGEDSQWVEVEGVVQGVIPSSFGDHRRVVRVSGDGGSFIVTVSEETWNEPDRVVDARVRLRGLAMAVFNSRGEITTMRVSVRRAEDFIVLDPPRADPFLSPTVDLQRLRPFSPGDVELRRQVAEGTLTFVSKDLLYVQDGATGIAVRGWQGDPVIPGDRVRLAGFVQPERGASAISNAKIRKLGHAGIPAVAEITPEAMVLGNADTGRRDPLKLAVDYDGRRVRFDAELVSIQPNANPARGINSITIRTPRGMQLFARFADGTGFPARALEPGCRLSLTGIAVLQYNANSQVPELVEPARIDLLCAGAEDLHVVRFAPYWTPARLSTVLALVGAVLGGTLLWLLLLRRVLRERTRRLEQVMLHHRDAELEFAAAKQERRRLAMDMHDGLQQMLVGAAFRLESAASHFDEVPPAVNEQLVAARRALLHTQSALRDCIWGLNEFEDGTGDFAALLGHAIASAEHWPENAVTVGVEGEPFPLARTVAGSLLLLIREAIANAFQHGRASRVAITLIHDPQQLAIRIEDDGEGFEVGKAATEREGHFGLGGMRERMKWLGGTVEVHSRPGRGASVTARLARMRAQDGGAVSNLDSPR
jgi:signal transduction histidine kinase